MREFKFYCSLVASIISIGWQNQASARCIPGRVDQYSEVFSALKTGYFPDDSEMEGGYLDRLGQPLQTLQDYVDGTADYASVAMDSQEFEYGTIVRIPDIEQYYGKCIIFKIVDTGGRFEGAGSSKIDICNSDEDNANSAFSNGSSLIYVIGGGGKSAGKNHEKADDTNPESESPDESSEQQEDDDDASSEVDSSEDDNSEEN